MFLIALTAVARYTPVDHPEDYDQPLGALRFAAEICIVLFIVSQCIFETSDLIRALKSRELTYLSTGMGFFHVIGWASRS